MFQTAAFEDERAGDRTAITQRGLGRSHWLELLLRLAEARYLRTGLVRNLSDALICLFDNHIKPLPKRVRLGADCYRRSRLYRRGVSEFLQKHKLSLMKLFKKLSTRVKSDEGPWLRLLDSSTWLETLKRNGILSPPLGVGDALTIFGLSCQRVISPEDSRQRATMLSFTGFLESLVRVADLLAVLRHRGRQRTPSGALVLPDILSDDEHSDSEESGPSSPRFHQPSSDGFDAVGGPLRSSSSSTSAMSAWYASCALIRTDISVRKETLGEIIEAIVPTEPTAAGADDGR